MFRHRGPELLDLGRESLLNNTVYWLVKNGRLNMPRWTPHDVRRTARSYWFETSIGEARAGELSCLWARCGTARE
jgi:hypothetical protein